MTVRYISGATMALLACGAIMFTAGRGLAQEPSAGESLTKGPVTLVGCLQMNEKGKFELANASSNVVESVPDPACTPNGSEMISLEGTQLLHLDDSVGKMVEISGKLEGSHKKQELRVRSFKPVAVVITKTIQTTRVIEAPPAPSAAAEPAPAPAAPAEKPVATSGELPKTASPLPLVALTGLMSLAGAFGLRLFRRREDA